MEQNRSVEPQQFVESVMAEHGSYISSVARRFAPSTEDAQDLVQTVALKLLEKPRVQLRTAQMRTWLFAVVRNAATDLFRASARQQRYVDSVKAETGDAEPTIEQDPLEHTEHESRLQRLNRAISRLPRQERSAIRNHLLGQRVLPTEAAAQKSRLHRGRTHLREILERDPMFDR